MGKPAPSVGNSISWAMILDSVGKGKKGESQLTPAFIFLLPHSDHNITIYLMFLPQCLRCHDGPHPQTASPHPSRKKHPPLKLLLVRYLDKEKRKDETHILPHRTSLLFSLPIGLAFLVFTSPTSQFSS